MIYNVQDEVIYNVQIDSKDIEYDDVTKNLISPFDFEVLIAPTNTDKGPYLYREIYNIKEVILKNVIIIDKYDALYPPYPPIIGLHIEQFDTIEQESTFNDKNVFILNLCNENNKNNNYSILIDNPRSGDNPISVNLLTICSCVKNDRRAYPLNNLLKLPKRLNVKLYNWMTREPLVPIDKYLARVIIELELVTINKHLLSEFKD